mmetsp:Transcript_4035/g.11301  ORF Transcript_4035/g.11301 Transcript_4035/m.11301 type:complete len:207 (+) Transcript_4035:93-713(+)
MRCEASDCQSPSFLGWPLLVTPLVTVPPHEHTLLRGGMPCVRLLWQSLHLHQNRTNARDGVLGTRCDEIMNLCEFLFLVLPTHIHEHRARALLESNEGQLFEGIGMSCSALLLFGLLLLDVFLNGLAQHIHAVHESRAEKGVLAAFVSCRCLHHDGIAHVNEKRQRRQLLPRAHDLCLPIETPTLPRASRHQRISFDIGHQLPTQL